MKLLTLFFLLLLYNQSFSQPKSETLTNETIIKLTKSKLPEGVILSKINQSAFNFDISTDGLIALKDNMVSDNVINLMIQKQGAADALASSSNRNNTNDRNYTFNETGIYFLNGSDYTSLDPTIVSSTNAKPGLFNIKYKSQLEGGEANYQLNSRRPDFYFNFEPIKKSLNDANANASSANKDNYLDQLLNKLGYGYSNSTYQAISPNDFKLIKLNKSKGKREFVAGKISAYGRMDMSIDSKNIQAFIYKKLSSNTFKITFTQDLEPGEYCFLYLGNNNNAPYMQIYGQNNMKVFDFGIK